MIDLGRYAKTLKEKPVALYGLGLSGFSCVHALVTVGVSVVAWDDDETKRNVAKSAGAKIDELLDLSGYAALVLSPGIPLYYPAPHPVVARARQAGVEIIGDIELLHRAGLGRKMIGITGTNGKSTTTALVGHILKECGIRAAVGGNIGKAVLDLDDADVFVLELSSYQLDLCPTFAPDIAVHLNLTPDHIDRHGDLEGYIAAKMRIFRGKGQAVIGIDDDPSREMLETIRQVGEREIFEISVVGSVEKGADVEGGVLFDAMNGEVTDVADLKEITVLPGVHNHQNAAAAYAIARLLGLKPATIVAAMKTYPGLPHRMFTVCAIGGIPYINDSKATNADAAGKALACYRDIHWILGGLPKAGGLEGLESLMDRVAQAYVIGQAADDFVDWLAARQVAVQKCGTLARALAEAHIAAQKAGRGVVLLSPACASYDQFKSFEHRGQVFTDLVKEL